MSAARYTDEELLALSGIQHFCFCRRQWALIHVERQWEENLRTAEGHLIHKRVDDPFFIESRGDVVISRAFPLVSYSLGFYGVADIIEYIRSENGVSLPGHEGSWMMRPVEYKRGKPKIDERDEVQLCAQAICIEEMFDIHVGRGDFYYNEIRRRVPLRFSDELRDRVYSLSDEMHDIFAKGITPPAETSRNCSLCSLQNICMPKLTKKSPSVRRYVRKHMTEACVEDV
ncbi:CRISPR-associated protein Cas4 [Methanoculleus sp. FWC-SCC1]|uniref:CRISPR-associated exonuclease Cas4 n=1 Tax=Methanoculleus frigidifontis TaxID=2584085 RepID=A0ABT8MDL8_9EURY|nr:CRISPR-associated protein Cas4 [Methanoculleus sp. FWC-SCC1]MDN7026033.1 CRISPR-associated protein Cas4 [Methanoculleus sp. FWC-SCC1]